MSSSNRWVQSVPTRGRLRSTGRRVGARVVIESMGRVGADAGQAEVDESKVVHDVAATDDEDALTTQRVQLRTQIEVVLERQLGIDRELQDRYVGGGEHVDQYRPGAVVDSPTVLVEPDVGRFHDVDDALGDRGLAGRAILDGEELGREAVEVVDRARHLHGRDGGDVDVPVRRDDEYRLWLLDRRA